MNTFRVSFRMYENFEVRLIRPLVSLALCLLKKTYCTRIAYRTQPVSGSCMYSAASMISAARCKVNPNLETRRCSAASRCNQRYCAGRIIVALQLKIKTRHANPKSQRYIQCYNLKNCNAHICKMWLRPQKQNMQKQNMFKFDRPLLRLSPLFPLFPLLLPLLPLGPLRDFVTVMSLVHQKFGFRAMNHVFTCDCANVHAHAYVYVPHVRATCVICMATSTSVEHVSRMFWVWVVG